MNQVDCEGEDQRESREEREMVLTTVQLRRASIMDTLVPQVRMTTMVVSLVCKGLVKSGLFVLSTMIIMVKICRGRRGGGKVASPAVGARGGAVGSTGFSMMVMVMVINHDGECPAHPHPHSSPFDPHLLPRLSPFSRRRLSVQQVALLASQH